jgi:hypothetical protein
MAGRFPPLYLPPAEELASGGTRSRKSLIIAGIMTSPVLNALRRNLWTLGIGGKIVR